MESITPRVPELRLRVASVNHVVALTLKLENGVGGFTLTPLLPADHARRTFNQVAKEYSENAAK